VGNHGLLADQSLIKLTDPSGHCNPDKWLNGRMGRQEYTPRPRRSALSSGFLVHGSRMIIERGKGEPALDVATSPPITLSIMIVWLNGAGIQSLRDCGRVVCGRTAASVDYSDPIRRLMVGPFGTSHAASSNISGGRPTRRRLRLNGAKACQTWGELVVCELDANHCISG
jgi:hypothetical protein